MFLADGDLVARLHRLPSRHLDGALAQVGEIGTSPYIGVDQRLDTPADKALRFGWAVDRHLSAAGAIPCPESFGDEWVAAGCDQLPWGLSTLR